jgi:hypothetical protein
MCSIIVNLAITGFEISMLYYNGTLFKTEQDSPQGKNLVNWSFYALVFMLPLAVIQLIIYTMKQVNECGKKKSYECLKDICLIWGFVVSVFMSVWLVYGIIYYYDYSEHINHKDTLFYYGTGAL